MRSRLKLVVTLSLALVVVVATWFLLTTPGYRPVVISVYEPAQIEAEQRIEDIGKVNTDSKAKAAFLIYNKGGTHLRISNVETSCGCTVAEVSKKVIAPGEFSRIGVTLDTSIKLGPVRKKITVFSNDPKRPKLDLFLTGDVIAQKEMGHAQITVMPKDKLVLFKGECATCHVQKGIGKTGNALFQADCAMCHGIKAQGNHSAGPSLLRIDFEKEAIQKQMRAIIANGSPHTPQMPPFAKSEGGPLSDDEIDSLISFLKVQNLKQKMGLLDKEEPGEVEDETAFQEALQNPH
jgi:mono/diheme cytochrome c family protein